MSHYQADPPGYIITITMDEGPQYHVSGVKVNSHIPSVDGAALAPLRQDCAGRRLQRHGRRESDRSDHARRRARQGYAFSEVRPHGDRDAANHTISLAFTVDDGPKVYIERIDIIGNTRTRDYVIRREFDIGEGDPYNHALIERAERRLNNLGYLQEGAYHQPAGLVARPRHRGRRGRGQADRLVHSGRLFDDRRRDRGSAVHRDQLPRPRPICELSASEGQYSRGWSATFTEPYFLDQRIAAGFDIYHKANRTRIAPMRTGRPASSCGSAFPSPTNSPSSRITRSTSRRSRFPTIRAAVQRLRSPAHGDRSVVSRRIDDLRPTPRRGPATTA